MSANVYDMRVWYMTRDYKDLYKIIKAGDTFQIIKYYSGELVMSTYYMLDAQVFMQKHCFSHEEYTRGVMNGN